MPRFSLEPKKKKVKPNKREEVNCKTVIAESDDETMSDNEQNGVQNEQHSITPAVKRALSCSEERRLDDDGDHDDDDDGDDDDDDSSASRPPAPFEFDNQLFNASQRFRLVNRKKSSGGRLFHREHQSEEQDHGQGDQLNYPISLPGPLLRTAASSFANSSQNGLQETSGKKQRESFINPATYQAFAPSISKIAKKEEKRKAKTRQLVQFLNERYWEEKEREKNYFENVAAAKQQTPTTVETASSN